MIKLLGKETIVPDGAKVDFLMAPVVGLAGTPWLRDPVGRQPLAGGLHGRPHRRRVPADVLPAISYLGGFSSGNSVAALGASREMKLVFAYELPFILALRRWW